MTTSIIRVTGDEAYDLIYQDHLATMSKIDQETMRRTMTNSSRCWLGYNDDHILALWGLIPPTLLSDRAYLWMHHTPHLREHVFLFVRHSQRMVEEMLSHYPILVGHTEISNRRAIRWLRWLGAEFGEPVLNNKALPFEIRAGKWAQQPSEQSA